MDMVQELLTMSISLFKLLYNPFKKFLLFSGLWLGCLLMAIIKLFKINIPYNVSEFLYFLTLLFAFYKTIENIFKIITSNGDFRLYEIIKIKKYNKEYKGKFPPNPVIKEMQTRDLKGFIFGKKKGRFVFRSETKDGHILVIGGAGSGKSSCIAIPTLLSWRNMVFAIDIKGELSNKSKKHRKNIIIFNPEKYDSIGYNPFYLLESDYENRVQHARQISISLIPIPPTVKETFWLKSAQNILTASILYFSGQDKNFIETITKILSVPTEILIEEIYNSDDEYAKLFISKLIGIDTKVLSGISTELSNNIMVFATDEKIKRSLSKSEFITPDDLENGNDVFIAIPENKLEQWQELLNLICCQFLKHFETRNEDNNLIPILFLLDEFARLGKIEPILNGLATLRSKSITLCIMTQSLSQLDYIYSKEQRQIIADNCSYKAILKATDSDTQKYFAELVGTYDKLKFSSNSNFEQYTNLGTGTGRSITTEEKKIIKPEEFAYLEDIILLSPKGFMRVDKSPYYLEKAFKDKI